MPPPPGFMVVDHVYDWVADQALADRAAAAAVSGLRAHATALAEPEHDSIRMSLAVTYDSPSRGGCVFRASGGVEPLLGENGVTVWGDLLGSALGCSADPDALAGAVAAVADLVVRLADRCRAALPDDAHLAEHPPWVTARGSGTTAAVRSTADM